MSKRLEKEERARRRLEEALRRSGTNILPPLSTTPKPTTNSIEEDESSEMQKD